MPDNAALNAVKAELATAKVEISRLGDENVALRERLTTMTRLRDRAELSRDAGDSIPSPMDSEDKG
jgi:hypothetical protein